MDIPAPICVHPLNLRLTSLSLRDSATPRLRGKNRETTRIFAGFIRFEQIKRMIGANDNLNESSNAAMSNLPWLRHLIRNALLTLQRQR